MTELAEAPAAGRDEAVTRIPHWIGGKRVEGTSGRSGPVYNPAARRPDGRGRPRLGRGDRRGRPERRRGVGVVAHGVARAARRALLPHPRAVPRAPRGPREAAHRRARQGALRRDGRGRARARGDRVRLRDPDARQGRVLRAGLDRDRRLLDPPAARRRRRHHAVQLPGDGAHVDVGARDRVRELLRPQAVREGPVRVAPHRRAAQGGRPPRRRLQRRPRRQGRRRRAARASRGSRPSRSSARRRSRATSTRPARSTASASRRSAARRTT